MARRLSLVYLAVVLGPLLLASLAFALRDLFEQRRRHRRQGNGRAGPQGLEHTVEEARAP